MLEAQRVEKDAAIRTLSDEKEDQRKTLQSRVDELELSLKKKELEVIEMRSKFSALETELDRRKDVESQFDTQKTRN